MGLSGPVDWWEEWQLRILVLGSLFIQYLLLLSAPLRKFAIPSWCRSIIWLAYLGSDAVAIYALATLFNRQRRQDCTSGKGSSILEVVWAPVLLMHLGGQDLITAYNIEDNELWTRHILTTVSQITVAIYVFFKSWPGGDKDLWQASILFFFPAILKCIEKPWALKSASINSLVSYSDPDPRMASMVGRTISLEEYVKVARAFAQAEHYRQTQGEGDTVDLEHNRVPQAQGEVDAEDLEDIHHPQDHGEDHSDDLKPNHAPKSKEKAISRRRATTVGSKDWEEGNLEALKLFVDLASSYPDRLRILESFWMLDSDEKAYISLQTGLFGTFDLLYTKKKTSRTSDEEHDEYTGQSFLSLWARFAARYLPFVAIGLFHNCHREAYNVNDVKVTYALFCCTAVLEIFGPSFSEVRSSGTVAQYSLIGFFARNKKHSKMMSMLSMFNCKDFLDQRWCMKSCFSSSRITALGLGHGKGLWKEDVVDTRWRMKLCSSEFYVGHLKGWWKEHILDGGRCMKSCSASSRITALVLGHVKGWWKEHIVDAASYRRFSDHRGQWTIQHKGCDQDKEWGLNRQFDESVLIWHIATDLCFYQKVDPLASHENAMGCREISNYMIYLLFINPEMLLPGTRRNLFKTGNAELEKLLKDDKPLLKAILKGNKPSFMEIMKGNNSFIEFVKGKGSSSEEIESRFVDRIIAKLQLTEHREKDPECTKSPKDAEQYPTQEGFIQDAWKISKALLALGDEKMWEVIEGVWVEMLCFSASRSRGYLHAKSLGTGGELLTYVWLLLSNMGMETLPERLQRTELSSGSGNATAASTYQVSTTMGEDIA